MKIEDIDEARELSRQRADLKRFMEKLAAQTSFKFSVFAADKEWRVELQNYDPPSNIGAAFLKVKAAITAMKQAQLDGVEFGLKAIGVEVTD